MTNKDRADTAGAIAAEVVRHVSWRYPLTDALTLHRALRLAADEFKVRAKEQAIRRGSAK